MDTHEKVKDELIKELQKLQQENNSLKALKEKEEAELVIANKELAFQNDEKEKRSAELVIANEELAFQKKIFTYLSADDIDNYYLCFYK
jgi:hypothetical protein